MWVYIYIYTYIHIQPIKFRVSFNPILQSQSNWSLFDGTWQKKRRELDNQLSFEIGEMTFQNSTGCNVMCGYIMGWLRLVGSLKL